MSSAGYFVKNYNIRQVVDLMCYGTKFPHTLTSTQKITRMYRYKIYKNSVQLSEGENNKLSIKIVEKPMNSMKMLELQDKN